jgi:hypothetical protein
MLPIVDYCSEVVFPPKNMLERLERVQRLVMRFHLHNFDLSSSEMLNALTANGLPVILNRFCANNVVFIIKYLLGLVHLPCGFVDFAFCLNRRMGNRLDSANDLVIFRNYMTDVHCHSIAVYSLSFKVSFLYRAVMNFNRLRRVYQLDELRCDKLRKLLFLLCYDGDGLVVT